jgi:adenylate kinase
MSRTSIGIYGETCAGKSTLGKMLSVSLSAPYISFGDLKRKEIAANTVIGREVVRLLAEGCPIPAKVGYDVISSAITDGLNLISGYPISEDELSQLVQHAPMVGMVVLEVNETTLLERFGNRRQCPICDMPGSVGESCPQHGIRMIERSDTNIDELVARRALFRKRINTFLESEVIASLPCLRLDTSQMSKDAVARRVEQWLLRLLVSRKGDIQWNRK